MNELERRSLNKFRRKPSLEQPLESSVEALIEGSSVFPEPERSREWREVEDALRAILEERKEAALRALAEAEDPRDKRWVRMLPKLSVSDLVKAAGKARSTVYQNHQAFLRDAQVIKEEVEKALAERQRAFRKATKAGLKAELREIKKELEQERAMRASESLTLLIERIGPAVRERSKLMADIASLSNKVQSLEADVLRLREQNRALSVALTRKVNQHAGED